MTRRREEAALVALLALLAACARVRPAPAPLEAAGAPGSTQHVLAVRDHGRLLVSLPPGWSATEEQEGEASVPSVRIEKPGAGFLVLLTPLWNPGEPESPQERIDTAQLFAEIARRKALAGAIEAELSLEELAGPGVRGFWFGATDRDLEGREPGPGEWRHVLQGAAAVGPVILAFTLLDNGPGPQRDEVLDLVCGARHAPDAAPDERSRSLEPMPDARTEPLRVAWPGASWAVLVDLPGFRVGRNVAPGGDALDVVAYQAQTGITASVMLRRGSEVKDAGGCRDAALAALTAAIPEVAQLRTEAGAAPRAWYVVAASDGARQLHGHAFLHRDGVCANVHVSKLAPAPEDTARLEAILATVRLVEDL